MYRALREFWAEQTAPGQPFEITEVEVGGQTLRVWANAAPSLREVWLRTAVHGDSDYLVYAGERWTYRQAHEQVARLAAWLSARGIGPGDRVAIAMRNYPEWLLAHWATVSIGAVVVGMNAWWVDSEMQFALEDSAAVVLIADAERLARFAGIRQACQPMQVVAVRTGTAPPAWAVSWDEVMNTAPALPAAAIDPEDVACIFYTSGTTGRPKGAQLTHRGCTNNLVTLVFSTFSQREASARAHSSTVPPPAQQMAALVTTPLFHVTANNCLAQTTTVNGGKLVLMYKWDAAEALRLVEAERVTNVTGVPVMMRELVTHPDFARRDTSTLTTLGGGGAAVQPDLIDRIEGRSTALRASQGYGMTETSGLVCAALGDFLADKPRSAGVVLPVFDVKCIDSAGRTLPPGEQGEICIRGPQVIKGYLNLPEATAETIVDGWLHTGDIGYLDEDHCIFLLDRARDMVIRGGENIYCSEVEAALHRHEAVLECAAFAVPDERLGEEVGAALVLAQGAGVGAGDLRRFCRDHLAAFKIPRYLWLLEHPLPRNASGKYLKRELARRLDPAVAG